LVLPGSRPDCVGGDPKTKTKEKGDGAQIPMKKSSVVLESISSGGAGKRCQKWKGSEIPCFWGETSRGNGEACDVTTPLLFKRGGRWAGPDEIGKSAAQPKGVGKKKLTKKGHLKNTDVKPAFYGRQSGVSRGKGHPLQMKITLHNNFTGEKFRGGGKKRYRRCGTEENGGDCQIHHPLLAKTTSRRQRTPDHGRI